jgi:(S)-2-hydroxyglutarate dehydrogenase
MTCPKRIIMVGGGIVGLAAAYQIGRRFGSAEITILEKEAATGRHQSTRNSGVLHAGVYYRPGSAKARLAVAGIRQMVEFCRENSILHEICGKLVVAANDSELTGLRELHRRGEANGLDGLRLLRREEMLEIEPHVGGVAALHVPQEGIVDYAAVCAALERKVSARGDKVVTRARVRRLSLRNHSWRVETDAGEFEGDFLVNCAGLFSDRVARSAGVDSAVRIVPFRGEYYAIRPDRRHLVRNLIYPVPDPAFPFLGVHFTRLIHGGIEAGPNAVLALAREGYRKTDFALRDALDALTFPGLWRFLARHSRMCWSEQRRSFSKRLFCAALQRLVPEIQIGDLSEGGAGVRAQAMSPDGGLVEDFHLLHREQALHVINAPSPAATASLAIGEVIAAAVVSGIG